MKNLFVFSLLLLFEGAHNLFSQTNISNYANVIQGNDISTGKACSWEIPLFVVDTWAIITPIEITAYTERIHIKANTPVNGIVFFSVPTSNADLSNKVLSLASAAILYEKRINVLYDKDDKTTGSQFGCQSGDCRVIKGISLLK